MSKKSKASYRKHKAQREGELIRKLNRLEKKAKFKAMSANFVSKLNSFKKDIDSKAWASDIWLREEWTRLGMVDQPPGRDDKFNHVLPPYIPDLVNEYYKYIIECDGSVHDLQRVKLADTQKDAVLTRWGYTVFRVEVYDMKMLRLIAQAVCDIRLKHIHARDVIIRKAAR